MDTARSRSLTLFLEIIAQAGGTLSGSHPMHAVFATRRLPDRAALVVPRELEETFLRWERYQERQFEKIALYGLWSVMVELLRLGIAHPDRMTAALRSALGRAETTRVWLPPEPLSTPVNVAEAWVLDRAMANGAPPGDAQITLVAQIQDGETAWDERTAASITLLLLTTAAWRHAREHIPLSFRRMHEEGGRERLCLTELARDVARRGNDALGSFASWALGTYVLAQANHTALTKLVQQGQYQFFVAQDESGYRLVKEIGRLDYVAYDKPHIEQALRMLAGLYLVRRGDSEVVITPEGKRVLEEAKSHHATVQELSVRAA
jgi:hypothetical protein